MYKISLACIGLKAYIKTRGTPFTIKRTKPQLAQHLLEQGIPAIRRASFENYVESIIIY